MTLLRQRNKQIRLQNLLGFISKMSLGLLLDKYDVSTEEGLQKALSEIEKEELEVDSALAGALSKASLLEGRLRSASQAYSKLGDVKTDTLAAAEMVEKTADLARDVSSKVRQLDLARSRVAECQGRVHDLIDLQLCSAGVEAAIKAHDYETGAAHVSRFLAMAPGSLAAARARGAADPRRLMAAAADTLRTHLLNKFSEAARAEDTAVVERLYKLFPQIGRAEEGAQLYAKYLASQLEVTIRRVSVVSPSTQAAGGQGAGGQGAGGQAAGEAVFVDALTRVLEAGAAAARIFLQTPYIAPFSLIQQKVDGGARHVYRSLCGARALDGGGAGGGAGEGRGEEPRAVEPALGELALMHARRRMYVNFLRRRAQAVAETLKEEDKEKCIEEMEKIISECELTRIAQDILGHYLSLERYFLEESVSKALKMSTPSAGAVTSSLVDDVFFIARKVIRRSVSAGSVDGLCAVLNEVCGALERDVAGALRRRLRAPPAPAVPLPAPAPAAAQQDFSSLALRINRDVDAQRALFLAHMNEAESGAEWAVMLATEACAEAQHLITNQTERDKLESCAASLGASAAAFSAALERARASLRAQLAPAVAAWAQRLADPLHYIDEIEEDADQLPAALEAFWQAARDSLSPRSAAALLTAVLTDLTSSAEKLLLNHYYTRESALCVERRARRVAAWSGAAGAGRERCAALCCAAALLAAELPAAEPRLPPATVRALLARRTDFKIEDIKKLRL